MKSKLIIFFMIAASSLFAQSLSFEEYLNNLKKEFKITQIQPDSLQYATPFLLDTREFDEYKVSHIKGAVFAGYNNFSLDQFKTVNKDTPIVVYCSVGHRSSIIAKKLIEAGFTDVRNLYGGIFNWVNQGRTIVRDSVVTDSIHSFDNTWEKYITNKKLKKIH